MDRRRRQITVAPDGRLTDEGTMRWYLDGLVRPRTVVERLSRKDAA